MGKKGLLLNTPEHLKRIRVIAPAPKKEKPKPTEKRATGANWGTPEERAKMRELMKEAKTKKKC